VSASINESTVDKKDASLAFLENNCRLSRWVCPVIPAENSQGKGW